MIHGTVWSLEDNPTDTPFYLLRTYDEKCFDIQNEDELKAFIRSDLDQLARFCIDEVVPDAPFIFLPLKEPVEHGHHKHSQMAFEIDGPNGPIFCEYYEDKWGMIWQIDASVMVKVENG